MAALISLVLIVALVVFLKYVNPDWFKPQEPVSWWKQLRDFVLIALGMIGAYVGYYLLVWARYRFFRETPFYLLVIYSVIVLAALSFLSLIPLAYIREWIPHGIRLAHLLFVLGFSILLCLLVVGIDLYNPLLKFVMNFFITSSVVYYLTFLAIVVFDRFCQDWIRDFAGTGMGGQAGVTSLAAVTAVLNIFLIRKLGESRDLSGAYETATRGHWATQEGKFYMNAHKWETGEWVPPLSAFTRFFFINVLFGIILAVVAYNTSLRGYALYFIYLGLLILFSVLFAFLAARVRG